MKELVQPSERGFTIIELMVVVLIIAILIAIAIPTLFGARQRAQDRATQAMLVNAAKAQAAYEASNVGYTDNFTVLAAEESSLDWTGSTDDAVHVVVSADKTEVLLYSRSNTGTWFGIRLKVGVRGSCMGPNEADVDDLTNCTTRQW